MGQPSPHPQLDPEPKQACSRLCAWFSPHCFSPTSGKFSQSSAPKDERYLTITKPRTVYGNYMGGRGDHNQMPRRAVMPAKVPRGLSRTQQPNCKQSLSVVKPGAVSILTCVCSLINNEFSDLSFKSSY